MKIVIKRDKSKEQFDINKIINAVTKAFKACDEDVPEEVIKRLKEIKFQDNTSVEDIQDIVEDCLMDYDHMAAKLFILYREQHKQARLIKDRIDYMDKYSSSKSNAASLSNTDANANVASKNVANLEGEVYKDINRLVQRRRMKEELDKLYPNQGLGKQYINDLEHHIIYTHDEASTPALKYYCQAVSLYPLMTEGVGNMDTVTPTPPNDIQSFSGQITNLTFLLSSQCKGAVAEVGYFVALNYYVTKEFGPKWYEKLDVIFTNSHTLHPYTIKNYILKGMKQYIFGVNQAAGNRSYNSPY